MKMERNPESKIVRIWRSNDFFKGIGSESLKQVSSGGKFEDEHNWKGFQRVPEMTIQRWEEIAELSHREGFACPFGNDPSQSCSFFFQQDFSLLDRPAVGAAFLVPPLLRIHQRPWPQLLYLPVCDPEFTRKNSSRLKKLFMRKLPLNGFASEIFACGGPQV